MADTSKQWDEMAKAMLEHMQNGPTVPPANAMLDAMHAAIPFSQATGILDNGCGTALATDLLLERYGAAIPAEARILATDFAANLIAQVRQHQADEVAKGNEAWQRVEPAVMDAQDLSGIADGALTHVMAGFVLFMVPDFRKALREIHRALTPTHGGGILAHSSWKRSDWVDLLILALREVRPDMDAFGKGLPQLWSQPEGVKEVMEAAGFRDVQVQEVETAMQVNSADAIADLMINKIPMGRAAAEKMQPEEVQRWVAVYAEKIRKAEPEKTGGLRGVALVCVGRK